MGSSGRRPVVAARENRGRSRRGRGRRYQRSGTELVFFLEKLAPAWIRGTVILIRPGRDGPCSFQVVARHESVFVTVKLSRQFSGPAGEIEAQYREEVFRLRMIQGPPGTRKELWIRSRYGRWRFFEVTDTGFTEVLVVG